MITWFIRCNGETSHNQPGTRVFMPGEPPAYPKRQFNYLEECLNKGFARVGFPAAGDPRSADWHSRASAAYGNLMQPHQVGYLEQFVSIGVGDIVVIPTYQNQYEVYLGVVIPPRNGVPGAAGRAYYYHFDIPAGDFFENAHRVDVNWARNPDGTFLAFDIPEIGGIWRRAFGQVNAGSRRIIQLARDSGLI